MNKFVIVVLLSSFGAIEASNQVPNLGSLTIRKTIECLLPVGDAAEPEKPPLFPLVPVPQGEFWPPPDPDNVPLYFENPSLRFTDMDLQEILDAHLIRTVPEGFTAKVFPSRSPQNELLRNFTPNDCQDLMLADVYSDFDLTADEPRRYLEVLTCDANFAFMNASVYYYPPIIASTKCDNFIRNALTCSFPGGANCAINRTCNFEDLNVLRWDCCWTWNIQMKKYVYDCGWRRIRIPIATACLCLCANKLNLMGLTRPPPPTPPP